MSDDSEPSRLVVACDRCGSVYAAVETSDGEFLPMGNRSGCSCGSSDFSRLPPDEVFASSDRGEASDDG